MRDNVTCQITETAREYTLFPVEVLLRRHACVVMCQAEKGAVG